MFSTTNALSQAPRAPHSWAPPSAAEILDVKQAQILPKEKLLIDNVVTAWWHGPVKELLPSLIALRAYYRQTKQADRLNIVASTVFAPWRPIGHSGTVSLAVAQYHLKCAKTLLEQNLPDLAKIAFMSGAYQFTDPENMLPPEQRPKSSPVEWVKEKWNLQLCQTVQELEQLLPADGPFLINLGGSKINELLPLAAKRKDIAAITVFAQGYSALNLSLLHTLPTLRELYLPGTIDDKSAHLLNGLEKVKRVIIYSSKLTDDGMNVFRSLTGLQFFQLDESKVTDNGIAQLADLPNLTGMSLYGLNITGKGFESGFQNLLSLRMQACALDDDGMKGIANLQNLQELRIYGENAGSKIGSKGISHVVSLKHLINLSLNRTQVDDECIPALSQLKSLKTLDLRGAEMSFEGLQKLEAALPNCRISPSPSHLAEYY